MKYCRCEKPTVEEVRAADGRVLATICAKCRAPPPDRAPRCREFTTCGTGTTHQCVGLTRDPSGLCAAHRKELAALPARIERMRARLVMLRGETPGEGRYVGDGP